MAADGGGNFGGNGSVSWKVISGDDDDSPGKHKCEKTDKRRDCHGVDKDYGKDFKISLLVPTDDNERELFVQVLQAASEAAKRATQVEIVLPIKKVADQIVIRWGSMSSSTSTTT